MAARKPLPLGRPQYGVPIRLTVDTLQDKPDKPAWVHVAIEGIYRGHPAAPVVTFSREVFDAVVANFRSHPKFKAGADGIGMTRVRPWDYEHASEMRPTEGSIPQHGAPACGWVLDLQVRDAADGTAQLWALTEFLDESLQQVRTGGYESCSVCIWPNAKDPVSGKSIGPMLTSIALTNHPFLEALEPIAAKRIAAKIDQWGEAESPEEALIGLRELFGLDAEADAAAVLAELQQLQGMLADGTVPSWADPEWLVSRMRDLLGLRTLATREEIFTEAVRMLSGLVSTSGGSEDTQAPTTEEDMPTALTARLATILGVRDSDEAICAAAEKAVEDSTKSTDALTQLMQLFESKDFNDLLTAANQTIAAAKKADTLIGALQEARGKLSQVNEAEADAEAEAVAASLTGTDKVLCSRLLPGIQSQRRACLGRDKEGNLDGTVDEARLKEFRASYPLPDEQRQYLMRRIVAGPNGTQLGGGATGAAPQVPQTQPIMASTPRQAAEPDPNSPAVLCSSFAGRNPTEKAVSYLRANRKDFERQEYRDQLQQAAAWLRQPVAPAQP